MKPAERPVQNKVKVKGDKKMRNVVKEYIRIDEEMKKETEEIFEKKKEKIDAIEKEVKRGLISLAEKHAEEVHRLLDEMDEDDMVELLKSEEIEAIDKVALEKAFRIKKKINNNKTI